MLAPLACALLAALPTWAAAPSKARAKTPNVQASVPVVSLAVPGATLAAWPQPALAPAVPAPAPLPAPAITLSELVNQPAANDDVAVPDTGRTLFDGAAAKWHAATSWVRGRLRPDVVSEDHVRLDGRSFRLTQKLGDKLYAAGTQHVVRLDAPAGERQALTLLAGTQVPHARLTASSADGRVLVKERISGESMSQAKARGYYVEQHKAGYALLAARLIEIGHTADLSPKNLLWERWRSRWVLVKGAGFRPGRPGEVLGPLLEDRGVEPVELLRSLRGHLGPDSQAWARTKADPALRPHMAALERFDARLPAAPALRFERAAADPVLSDEVVSPKELVKRLGYEPWGPGVLLQLDKGKLNTRVHKVRDVVRKQAAWDIIQNELVMRKVVRRWFGRYFQTPGSLAVQDGFDSTMIMRYVDAGKSYAGTRMSLEQRMALAVLVHTFGLSDMNEDNVLYADGELPILIDFEQALSRRTPNTSRLPDARIAAEMPWMTRKVPNVPETFFAGVRAWRALFLKEETQRELRDILLSSGMKPDRAELMMGVFKANLAGLEGVIQADAEFVNRFVKPKES